MQAGKTSVLCTGQRRAGRPRLDGRPGTGLAHRRIRHAPRQHHPAKRRDRAGKIDGRSHRDPTTHRPQPARRGRPGRPANARSPRLRRFGGRRRHRTYSITGGFIALVDALRSIVADLPAAKRLRRERGRDQRRHGRRQPMLDLDCHEDFDAAVDMNVVMTGAGRFIEVQGTGEEATFSEEDCTRCSPWPVPASSN